MTRPTVLIAEDESLIAEELKDRIERSLGFDVIGVVASGEQAVARASERRPDLVLMDIHLRGAIDGIEAATRIRQVNDIPIVYLTAHSDPRTVDRAKATRPYGYLLKPFAERDLRITLGVALANHELEKRLREGEERLRQIETRVLQARKAEAIGRLAGGIAETYNNILQVIVGNGELLQLELEPGAEALRLVQPILDASERAASLGRQLAVLSSQHATTPVVMSLDQVLGEHACMLGRILGAGVTTVWEAGAGPGSVLIDRSQLQHVLMELALNAREAMPAGGTLTLRSSRISLGENVVAGRTSVTPGSFLRISVEDTGVGMAPDVIAHLFEPFFTTKDRAPGKWQGLGLATIHAVVHQAGGFLEVHSVEGRGTTVDIYLPEVTPVENSASAFVTFECGRGTESILLVEEDDDVRHFAASVLRRLGYTVLEASGRTGALELLEVDPRPIQLLVTDLGMTQMCGTELARRLTEVRPGIKVLFISGYLEDLIARDALLACNASFLPKPFTARELSGKVRSVLDRPAGGR